MFGRIHLWSHLLLDFCFLGFLWLLIQFHCWLSVCSNFVSSCFSFGSLYVSRNLSISSRVPNYWHIIAHNILFLLFVFLQCCLSSLLLHLLFIWVLSSLFLINLARGLSILLILSRNQLLVSLICSTLFLFFWFQYYWFPIFCWFGALFAVLFSSSFKCKFRLCIWDLSSFLGRLGLLYTSLLEPHLLHPKDLGLSCFHFHWFPCTL